MPPLPTKLRAPFWLFASALPLVLTAAGCPQLATDEFTKANIDSDGGGSSNPETADGSGGTHPVDISNAGGSGPTATTSQGGTDANGGTGATDGDTDTTETDSSASTEAVTTDGETTDSGTTDGGSTDDGSTDSGTTASASTNGGTTTGDALPDCMDAEICDGLDNNCDEEIDEDDVCAGMYACAGVALEFQGEDHGYMFCARPAGWNQATTQCEAHGMALVQIDSEDENEALATEADVQFAGDGGIGGNTGGGSWTGGSTRGGGGTDEPVFWAGGSDGPDQENEGNWVWVGSATPFWEGDADGTSVDDAYTSWGDGRPNEANDETPEDCLAVYFQENSDGADVGTWNDLACDYEYPFVCEAL